MKSLNLKTSIAAACAVAGLCAAGVSQAANYVLNIPAANTFFISGSTALDTQLSNEFNDLATGPCQAAPTLYTGTDGHVKLWTCGINATWAALTGQATGTTIAIEKESNGGSFEGTAPVAEGTTLTFMDPSGTLVCSEPGGVVRTGCAEVAKVPTFGVADEDPGVFTVGSVVSAADKAALTTTPMFQNMFGVAVSLNLYRALQREQGLGLTDTLANMPSLSRKTVAALFSGQMTDWTTLLNTSGAAVTTFMTTAGETLKDTTVFLCRRPTSSGTNAGADIYFLGNRCSGTSTEALPMKLADTIPANCTTTDPENKGCAWGGAGAGNLADTSFPGSATSDDTKCLSAHDSNNEFAVGYLGSSSQFDDPNGLGGSADAFVSATGRFRFVAIDGSKPILQSLANGTYDYAFDNVMNRKSTLANPGKGFADKLATVLQTAQIQGIITTQAHAGDANYAVGGLLDALNGAGVGQNTPPVTLAQLQGTGGTPVSAVTFALTSVNGCQRAVTNGPILTKEAF